MLKLQKLILVDKNLNIFQSIYSLALFCSGLGQYKGVMHLYNQTSVLQKHIVSNKHPDIFQFIYDLEIFYSKLSQYQKAMYLHK